MEMDIDVVIAARAFADAKYQLASGGSKEAHELADTEYQRLINGYQENGDNSELAQRKRAVEEYHRHQ